MAESLVQTSSPGAIALGRGVGVTLGRGTSATTVFDGANWKIESGDLISLSGPSGTGKSTVLHLLSGIVQPTLGTVSWPALGTREELRPRHVSIAFQGPSLMAPLTLLENVALPLLLLGVSEEQARVEALQVLDRIGLGELCNRLPEELSGGQSQRGGVARACVGHPQLILADEPTGQSDHGTGDRLMNVLIEMATTGGSALVVATHDLDVAQRMNRHWVLRDGQLETDHS